jgi:hypothetical protein
LTFAPENGLLVCICALATVALISIAIAVSEITPKNFRIIAFLLVVVVARPNA